jgi:hypothetical protein
MWWWLAFRSTRSVRAENLFLRRQLALYVERGVKAAANRSVHRGRCGGGRRTRAEPSFTTFESIGAAGVGIEVDVPAVRGPLDIRSG